MKTSALLIAAAVIGGAASVDLEKQQRQFNIKDPLQEQNKRPNEAEQEIV